MEEVKKQRGKLLSYDIKVRQNVSSITRRWEYSDKTVLNSVVSNLISCIRKGKVLVYSRNQSEKTLSKKKVTVMKVLRCVDWLEEMGYITNHVGTGSRVESYRVISHLEPTEKFIDTFKGCNLLEIEIDYVDSIDCIILRDENKQSVSFREDGNTRQMRDEVKNLNLLLNQFEVKDGEGNILDNVYNRIFNKNFNLGGRWYNADILTVPNRDKARLDATINGEKVVEADYNSLHLRMATALEGIHLDTLERDAYAIVECEPSDVNRAMIKFTVNVMFNCSNKRSAIGAVRDRLSKLSKEEKREYSMGSAKNLVDTIYNTYFFLQHRFCKEGDFGMQLQNLDSKLAARVVEHFVDAGEPILPIHDSFVTTFSNAIKLTNIMGVAFREMFDMECFVPIVLQYNDYGEGVKRLMMEYH